MIMAVQNILMEIDNETIINLISESKLKVGSVTYYIVY